jgi:hypothetical protein
LSLDLDKINKEINNENDAKKLQNGISRMNGIYKLLAVGILKAIGTFNKLAFEERVKIEHFLIIQFSLKNNSFNT